MNNKKKRVGWTLLSNYGKGRNIFVRSLQYPMYKALMNSKEHSIVNFISAILKLGADAHSNSSVNSSGTIRSLFLSGGTNIRYYIDDSDVLIDEVDFPGLSSVLGRHVAGIYPVFYRGGNDWVADSRPVSKVDYSHTWNAAISRSNGLGTDVHKAHFACVAGRFENSADAGQVLATHIKKSYGDLSKQFNSEVINQQGNHFSMLWLNRGEHESKLGKELVGSLIDDNARSNARVHTLIHGEAALAFVKATKELPAIPSLRSENIGFLQFFFSNPVGATPVQLKESCERIGALYIGSNLNPRSLGQSLRNSVSELANAERNFKTFARGLHAVAKATYSAVKHSANIAANPAVVGGIAAGGSAHLVDVLKDASGVTAAFESAEAFTKILPLLTSTGGKIAIAAVGGLCALKIGVDMYKNMSSVGRFVSATARSTFGAGNQYWYDNDRDFLARMK